jgi:uncharacterized peroxidase-related enzyme
MRPTAQGQEEQFVMARVPLVEPGHEAPNVTPLYRFMEQRYGRALNMFRAYANAPHVAEGLFLAFAKLFGEESRVPERIKHLAIMATDRENGCKYCIATHNMRAPALNISPEQMDALDQRFDDDRFDEQERTVIAYARDVTKNVAVSEATFEPLRRYFTAAQTVEMTAAIGYYNMLNRLNESLQVEYDFA